MSLDSLTGVRAVAMVAALGGWFWTQKLLARRTPPTGGIGDRVHAWTAPLHACLVARPRVADAVLIA